MELSDYLRNLAEELQAYAKDRRESSGGDQYEIGRADGYDFAADRILSFLPEPPK